MNKIYEIFRSPEVPIYGTQANRFFNTLELNKITILDWGNTVKTYFKTHSVKKPKRFFKKSSYRPISISLELSGDIKIEAYYLDNCTILYVVILAYTPSTKSLFIKTIHTYTK